MAATDRPTTTGVVFVHGIGSQAQSSTVREFAEPLLDYLREWHRTRGHPEWEADAADLSYGGTLTGPARVALHVPAYADGERTWPERRFIFAEGWWAARLEPPPFDVMLVWSVKTLWGVVAQIRSQLLRRVAYLLRPRTAPPSDPGPIAALGEILSAVAYVVAYVVAAILGYLVLIPLLVIAYIPIDALQQFVLVKLLKPFLVEQIGDHETYMYDDVQALNIRSAVADAIRDLVARGCERIVVLAHSQGTLVAFDAVCALGQDDPVTAAHVRKLITFGGALNRAFAKEDCPPRLLRTLPSHIFWLDIWSQYDPVAGGYLRRRVTDTPLVDPPEPLRERMRWSARFDGPLPDQVTNSMNPVVDHGGYFHNVEQFANRVLAEIDDADDYYQRSRFFFVNDSERVRRRRTRISALAWWRLVALGGLALALVLRGTARLAEDGRNAAQLTVSLPGHDLLTAPRALVDGVGSLLDRVAQLVTGFGLPLGPIADLRAWWSGVAWSDLLTGVLLSAALFALLYFAALWLLYRPWDERERRAAIAPVLPEDPFRPVAIALRALAVIAVFAVAVAARA